MQPCMTLQLLLVKKRLATRQLLLKIAELELELCARRQGEFCHPLLTWCLNRAWLIILQPILHTSTSPEEPMRTDLLLCPSMHLLLKAEKQSRDDSIAKTVQCTTPPYISLMAEKYVGWSCVLNCFMLSSIPCFPER